jgi:hypothetical protein
MNNLLKIIVSEPWDFVNSDGNNILLGSILRVINEKCCIFQTIKPVSIDGITSEVLILGPRYRSQFISDFYTGEGSLSVNISLLTITYTEAIDEQTMKLNSVFSMIGSIERGD